MPYTTSGGPAIYFETSGNASDEPIVLVSGAGAQLVWWREAFVQKLVDIGLFVIRLDNRDVGLSDKFGGPSDVGPVYTVDDMADDVCRVLDALAIGAAHIVGQSLGGAITQAVAITRPERVRSMVLFYTVPGFDPRWLTDELQQAIFGAPPVVKASPTREAAIAAIVEREQLTRSTEYPFDDAWLRELAMLTYDRGHCPGAVYRHAAAGATMGDRSAALKAVTVPTAIIHGRVDRLLKAEGSFELARLIPDSELHIYPGMGHEIVEPLWGEFATIIARTVARTRR